MSFQAVVDALDAEREVTREVIEDLRQQNHDLREQSSALVEALRDIRNGIASGFWEHPEIFTSWLAVIDKALAPYDTKAPDRDAR